MKVTNRIISLLLALVMVLGMLPASVFASDVPDVTIVAPRRKTNPFRLRKLPRQHRRPQFLWQRPM